jgi:hypothetical protein
MKTVKILAVILILIIIIGVYTMFVRTPFDPTISAVSTSTKSNTATPTPTLDVWDAYWRKLQAEAGVAYDSQITTETIPHLKNKQLRDENTLSLMMQNNAIRREFLPDLYSAEDAPGVIAEDQPQVESSPTNNDAVYQKITYDHDNSSIIGAGANKEIGTSIADIGKSITELPGEINVKLGYSGYKVDSDYNLLPASLYNNMWDYKQDTTTMESSQLHEGGSSDILDKLPRTIIQKDFEGVSNIFAPNFIFLGNKDDYSIGFDGNSNWQYP